MMWKQMYIALLLIVLTISFTHGQSINNKTTNNATRLFDERKTIDPRPLDSIKNIYINPVDQLQNIFPSPLDQPKIIDTSLPGQPKNIDTILPGLPKIIDTSLPGQPKNIDTSLPDQPKNIDTSLPGQPKNIDASLPGQPKNIDTSLPDQPKNIDTRLPDQPKNIDTSVSGPPKNMDNSLAGPPKNMDNSLAGPPKNMDNSLAGQTKNMDTSLAGQTKNMDTSSPRQFYQEMLEAHNKYRASHCAPPLRLDDELCRLAQMNAERLASTNGKSPLETNGAGQNMYVKGIFGNIRLKGSEPTSTWYNGIRYYNFKQGDFSMETGTFTQVVWASTQRLGTGIAYSPNGRMAYVVALYLPPGNYGNEFDNNVSPAKC